MSGQHDTRLARRPRLESAPDQCGRLAAREPWERDGFWLAIGLAGLVLGIVLAKVLEHAI